MRRRGEMKMLRGIHHFFRFPKNWAQKQTPTQVQEPLATHHHLGAGFNARENGTQTMLSFFKMALSNAASPTSASHSSQAQHPQPATSIPSSASSPASPTQQAPFAFASSPALSHRPRALSLPSPSSSTPSSSTTSQTIQDASTELEFCKDIYCCGIHLTDFHQLQIHGELFHSIGGTSVAALASLIELRRVSSTASAFAPTTIVSMARRNGTKSLRSSRRTSMERPCMLMKPPSEDTRQLPASVTQTDESSSLSIPSSSSVSAPEDASTSVSLSTDAAASTSTAVVSLESGVDNDLKIGFDDSDNEDDERKESLHSDQDKHPFVLANDGAFATSHSSIQNVSKQPFRDAIKPLAGYPSFHSCLNAVMSSTASSFDHTSCSMTIPQQSDSSLISAIHYVESMQFSPSTPPDMSDFHPASVGAVLSPIVPAPRREVSCILSPMFPICPDMEPAGILPPALSLPCTATVDSLLQPPHTLPPDESDVVTITFEEEQESPPRDVIGSEILATSRNLFSGCSPLLVAAHPIISLKDIYNDTNVLEGVDADYVLRGIFSLDADESSGPTVADRSGDDTDSDSLMSDMDCDYENCDDDEGLRVMTSVAASRATHSSPNKPPLSLQRQELNVHAHNGRTLRHAPHVDYSPYAQPLPQQPRRRGRPRLNRYLLPPSHPKYLPMPAMTPIPSGGNEASSSNPAPIRIKLRLGSVTATVTDMTLAPAGPPGSAPASEHPLSPPQSVSSSAEQLADPMQQMIPLDEQLLATLGPAASAAMRRRMREGIRAITAQELMAATMPLAPGQTLTRTGNPPAPPPLGPDGKPIKRGRGRPRKRPRPEDGLLPPPPPQLPSRPPLRPQRQAAVVPGPIVETPEEILDETGYEFEFASSDPALPQGSDETNNYVESSALVSDSHQPESVDVPEPIEEPARVSDINESVPEEDLQAMDAALSPDLIWVEEGKLATECDIAAPSSVTASPSEGVSAPLTSVALTAGPASSKRKGKDTKKRRQTAHSLDADVSRLEPPAKKAKTIFAPSSRRRQSAPAQEAIEIIADENVDVNLGKETHDDPRAAEQDCLLVDPSSEAPAQPIDATFSVAPENVANHREVLKKLHVYHLKIQDAANKRKTDAQTLGARSGPPPDIVHSLSLISAHNARKRALHASMNTTSSTECGSSSAGESNASPLVSIAAYSDLPALLYAANPVVLTGRRLKLGALALVPPGTNEKRYICPGCGKDYKNANGVKYHLNREHNDAKGIPVLLLGGGIDGVSSSNVADGGDEDNEEEGEGLFVADLVSDKPFLCFLDHCEKPFKSLAGLRYHMRSLHASYLTESEHEKILQAYNLADDSAFRVTPTGSATSFAASATTTLISKEKTLSSAKSTQISVAGTGQKASNRNDRKRKMRPSPESNDEVVAIPVSDEDMVGEPAIIPSVTKRVNVDLGALLFDSDGENDEVEEEVDELAESEDAQEDEDRQLRKGKSASASSAAVVTDRRRSSRVSR